MNIRFAGIAEEVFKLIEDMKNIAQSGGDIVYEGYRKDGEPHIFRIEISGDGKCLQKNLDPAPSQALYNHSPDGFEWGYMGSGPAQLALAIVLDATGNKVTALKYHQEFKSRFVGLWPQDYFHIKASQVQRFIILKQNYELINYKFQLEPEE